MSTPNQSPIRITNGMLLAVILALAGTEYRDKIKRMEQLETKLLQIILAVDRLEQRAPALPAAGRTHMPSLLR